MSHLNGVDLYHELDGDGPVLAGRRDAIVGRPGSDDRRGWLVGRGRGRGLLG